jgi:hypothetical protein
LADLFVKDLILLLAAYSKYASLFDVVNSIETPPKGIHLYLPLLNAKGEAEK